MIVLGSREIENIWIDRIGGIDLCDCYLDIILAKICFEKVSIDTDVSDYIILWTFTVNNI